MHGYLGASKKKNGCIGDPSCYNIKLWYCVFCVFLQVQHISTAALVWLWSRTDLQKSFLPIVMVFMAVTCYRPLVIEYVETFFEHYIYYVLIQSLGHFVYNYSFYFLLRRAFSRYMLGTLKYNPSLFVMCMYVQWSQKWISWFNIFNLLYIRCVQFILWTTCIKPNVITPSGMCSRSVRVPQVTNLCLVATGKTSCFHVRLTVAG